MRICGGYMSDVVKFSLSSETLQVWEEVPQEGAKSIELDTLQDLKGMLNRKITKIVVGVIGPSDEALNHQVTDKINKVYNNYKEKFKMKNPLVQFLSKINYFSEYNRIHRLYREVVIQADKLASNLEKINQFYKNYAAFQRRFESQGEFAKLMERINYFSDYNKMQRLHKNIAKQIDKIALSEIRQWEWDVS